jgi:hypothetical protein
MWSRCSMGRETEKRSGTSILLSCSVPPPVGRCPWKHSLEICVFDLLKMRFAKWMARQSNNSIEVWQYDSVPKAIIECGSIESVVKEQRKCPLNAGNPERTLKKSWFLLISTMLAMRIFDQNWNGHCPERRHCQRPHLCNKHARWHTCQCSSRQSCGNCNFGHTQPKSTPMTRHPSFLVLLHFIIRPEGLSILRWGKQIAREILPVSHENRLRDVLQIHLHRMAFSVNRNFHGVAGGRRRQWIDATHARRFNAMSEIIKEDIPLLFETVIPTRSYPSHIWQLVIIKLPWAMRSLSTWASPRRQPGPAMILFLSHSQQIWAHVWTFSRQNDSNFRCQKSIISEHFRSESVYRKYVSTSPSTGMNLPTRVLYRAIMQPDRSIMRFSILVYYL